MMQKSKNYDANYRYETIESTNMEFHNYMKKEKCLQKLDYILY